MLKSRKSADAENLLLVAEYQALRAEVLQTIQSTQSIVQWSMAAYGVLFGAGVVAASDPDARVDGFLRLAILLIFGVLIPALLAAATWHWLGELTRMERVAVFLRGLEHHLRKNPAPHSLGSPHGPLNWERFLAGDGKTRKRRAPYVGIALLFSAGFAVSVCFALLWIWSAFQGDAREWFRVLSVVFIGLITVAYAAVSCLLGKRIFELARSRSNFGAAGLIRWP